MKSLKLIAAATALALGASLASAGTTSVDFHRTSSLKGLSAFTCTSSHDRAPDQLTTVNNIGTRAVTGIALEFPSADCGGKTLGVGVVQLPDDGCANRGPTAVPLPSAAYMSLMTLSIMGAVTGRKRLAAMFV